MNEQLTIRRRDGRERIRKLVQKYINSCYSLERIIELEVDKGGLSIKVSKKELNTILAEIDIAKDAILLGYKRLEELGLVSFKDTATE